MEVKFVEPKKEYLDFIVPRLRAIDRFELEHMSHTDALSAIQTSISLSLECYVALVKDEPIAVLGVSKPLGWQRAIWMVATDSVSKFKKTFYESSHEYIEHARRTYGKLCNVISCDNHDSMKWLQREGFTIYPPQEYDGKMFCYFEG